jgi:hypothetical protein
MQDNAYGATRKSTGTTVLIAAHAMLCQSAAAAPKPATATGTL